MNFNQVRAAAIELCKAFEEGDPEEWLEDKGWRWEAYSSIAINALRAAVTHKRDLGIPQTPDV